MIKPPSHPSQQQQLIPNFTAIEVYTDSGQCFPLILPSDASLSDILQWAEAQTGVPNGLLPFHQGEPCHHNESPLFTLVDHLSRLFDCDPIVIRASGRRRNNILSPAAWAAQVSRDLSGYTTSIAVFLAWLAQGAQAHNQRSQPPPHISFSPTLVLALTAIALTLYIYKRLPHRHRHKRGTRLLFTTIINPSGQQQFHSFPDHLTALDIENLLKLPPNSLHTHTYHPAHIPLKFISNSPIFICKRKLIGGMQTPLALSTPSVPPPPPTPRTPITQGWAFHT